MSPCYQWRRRIEIFSTHLWASIICSGATSYKTLFLLPGVSVIVHLNERTVGRKNQNSSTMFVWRKYLSFYVNIFMCSLPIDDTIHLLLFPFFSVWWLSYEYNSSDLWRTNFYTQWGTLQRTECWHKHVQAEEHVSYVLLTGEKYLPVKF